MIGSTLAIIKARLSLSSIDTSKREGPIATYAGLVNNLLWRYIADVAAVKANEKIRNFDKGLLITCDFCQNVSNMTTRCKSVSNQILLQVVFFVKASTRELAEACTNGARIPVRPHWETLRIRYGRYWTCED